MSLQPTLQTSYSSRQIFVIAGHTFTQLVRMKVFYFLAFFALVMIASNFMELPQNKTPEFIGIDAMRSIKSWGLGTMTLFSTVLCITSTALLIPKDIEDRTLYTIISKPVPRIYYLIGKLLGLLMLVFISLAIMDGLMTSSLYLRTTLVIQEQTALAKSMSWSDENTRAIITETQNQGPNASLQWAVLAVFFRAAIMATIALFISTFSSSTILTIVLSFMVYFIAHFQADARETFLSQQPGMIYKIGTALVTLIFPDFQIFNLIDGIIQGKWVAVGVVLKMAFVTSYHLIFYTIASWFVFSRKEF